MRGSLTTLLVVSALASALLAAWYLRRIDTNRMDPPIEIARVPERLPVLAGGNADLEVLLQAYLPEHGQDAFNRERLDQMLGLKNPGLDYLRLWIVNRGTTSIPFDSETSIALEAAGRPDWQSRSLALLVAEAVERASVGRADLFVLEGLARRDLTEIAGRAFVELVVALPREPEWTSLDQVTLPALGGIELRRAKVAPEALERFLSQPQGELLDRLVVPAALPDSLQASRK